MFKLKYGCNDHLPMVQAGVRGSFMEKILTWSEPLLLTTFDLKDREVKATESRRTIGLKPRYVQEWDVSTTEKV